MQMKDSCKSNLDLHFLELDLQNLQSVKSAATDFIERECQLDLLTNDAGVSTSLKLSTNRLRATISLSFISSFTSVATIVN